MFDLPLSGYTLLLTAVFFVWSGFVRSGFGFGGAALSLPLLLLLHDDPLFWLPAICWQLLIFSTLTVATRWKNIDWRYLTKLFVWLFAPFTAGLIGLLNLPANWLALVVYLVSLGYGINYALDRSIASHSRLGDVFCILVGVYASGTSLVGAPLIVAFSARRLAATQLRDTLFVMWMVLVVFKLATFVAADVNLQFGLFWLTLPFVAVGHLLGLRAHQRLVGRDRRLFSRVIGGGLALVSAVGIGKLAMDFV